MTYTELHAHYMCPMVKDCLEDTEENEEMVECFIFESNGLIVINATEPGYRERCFNEDKFLFYLDAGYIEKLF